MAVAAAALSGCGGAESGGGVGGNGATGCLSPAQVEAEVSRIAEGFEGSSEEVEAKTNEIAAVRAEAC